MKLFAELQARGLIHQFTESAEKPTPELLDTPGLTVYGGFDPTSRSLHVGNLIPLLGLRRFQLAGHKVILLAGGATGMVGDPSGKSQERNLLDEESLRANVAGIKGQLERLIDFSDPTKAVLVDNLDWTKEATYLGFLRDVGKHFTINSMLRKDSVRKRVGALSILNLGRKALEELVEAGTFQPEEVASELAGLKRVVARLEETSEESRISYTEFSYMLLQAYDFLVLHREHGCTFQVGGSDQWGNITCGTELIRRVEGKAAHGLTFPLLTNTDGSKFGKTAKGAVWLDPEMTSPYDFYQFWVRTQDADVIQRLRYFTFLPLDEIAALESSLSEAPREAQRRLAREMTAMLHGAEEAAKVEKSVEVFFYSKGDWREAPVEYLTDAFSGAPIVEISRARFAGEGLPLLDLVVEAVHNGGQSRGKARRDIEKDKSIALNGTKWTDPQALVTSEHLLHDSYLVLKKGKKSYFLVKVVD